jgi:lambda repressor-like predicted transcriptional regulator
MDVIERRVLVLRKFGNQYRLAAHLGCAVSAVNAAIKHGKGSDELLKRIAEALGTAVCQIWPERFPHCDPDENNIHTSKIAEAG